MAGWHGNQPWPAAIDGLQKTAGVVSDGSYVKMLLCNVLDASRILERNSR